MDWLGVQCVGSWSGGSSNWFISFHSNFKYGCQVAIFDSKCRSKIKVAYEGDYTRPMVKYQTDEPVGGGKQQETIL